MVGATATVAGELIRAWAMAHIGSRSRTRGADMGEQVVGGPFGWSRNPIYLGNLLVGAGMAWAAHVPVLFGLFVALFFVQHGFIVAWEEERLLKMFGERYLEYCRRVARWLPRPSPRDPSAARYGWRAVLRSERSTLAVQGLVYTALGVLGWFRVGG